MNTPIKVSAVALFNAGGELLTVRKRGTSKYMLPGGKPGPGESARDCAVREISEEVGVMLRPEELIDLGNWLAPAANEPQTDVHAAVFSYGLVVGEVRIQAEIDAKRWIDPRASVADDYAPLLTELLPLLDRNGSVPSSNDGRPDSGRAQSDCENYADRGAEQTRVDHDENDSTDSRSAIRDVAPGSFPPSEVSKPPGRGDPLCGHLASSVQPTPHC